MNTRPDSEPPRFSRRDGLKALGAYLGGALLVACNPRSSTPDLPTTLPTAEVLPPTTIPVIPASEANAGAPEGATGKNAEGEWIKTVTTENGKTFEFAWKPEFEGWFRPLTPERIPAIDFNDANLIPITVYMSEDVQGSQFLRFFSHQDKTEGPRKGITFTGVVLPKLYQRYYGNSPSSIPSEFKIALLNGDVPGGANPIVFTTPDGIEHTWIPSSEKGVIVFIRGWQELEPVEGNGVSEWKDPYGTSFRSRIGMDEGGNVTSEIAPEVPLSSLSDEQLRQIVVFHLARVLDRPGESLEGYSTTVNIFADTAGEGSVPHIQIIKQ